MNTDPKTDEQPTVSAGDVEKLGTLIESQAALLSTGSDQQDWFRAKEIAEAILASDWLATLLADVRREERERAWDEGRASLMEDAANYCSRSGLACLVDYPDVNPYRVREARGGAR